MYRRADFIWSAKQRIDPTRLLRIAFGAGERERGPGKHRLELRVA